MPSFASDFYSSVWCPILHALHKSGGEREREREWEWERERERGTLSSFPFLSLILIDFPFVEVVKRVFFLFYLIIWYLITIKTRTIVFSIKTVEISRLDWFGFPTVLSFKMPPSNSMIASNFSYEFQSQNSLWRQSRNTYYRGDLNNGHLNTGLLVTHTLSNKIVSIPFILSLISACSFGSST